MPGNRESASRSGSVAIEPLLLGMPAKVRCPTCGKTVAWIETEKYRPFCSERCKLIDLGAWASEAYAISGSAAGEADRDDGEEG